MKDYNTHQPLIAAYVKAIKDLKDHGILTNKKDFTSQIGEWLVSELFDSIRATNPIQKDWDMLIENRKVQVKTHAKAATNSNRKTHLNYEVGCEIDELIIVAFSETYSLKDLYRVPWKVVCEAKEFNKERREIYWSTLKSYKVDLFSIKNQSVLELFR